MNFLEVNGSDNETGLSVVTNSDSITLKRANIISLYVQLLLIFVTDFSDRLKIISLVIIYSYPEP